MSEQLLQNPDFKHDNSTATEYRYVNDHRSTIVKPAFWQYVADAIPGQRFAESFNKPDGFELGGSYRQFRAGYAQTPEIVFEPGQRYVIRATFTPEIYAGNVQKYDPYSVRVYFRFDEGAALHSETWLNPSENHHRQTIERIFEVNKRGKVHLSFWMESKWALIDVKMRVHSITVDKVPRDTGIAVFITPNVLVDPPTIPDPPKPEPPTPPTPPTPETIAVSKTEYDRLRTIEAQYMTLLGTLVRHGASARQIEKAAIQQQEWLKALDELVQTIKQEVGQLLSMNTTSDKEKIA